jgi:hypothetical protein
MDDESYVLDKLMDWGVRVVICFDADARYVVKV